jgi:hypothetical protein
MIIWHGFQTFMPHFSSPQIAFKLMYDYIDQLEIVAAWLNIGQRLK